MIRPYIACLSSPAVISRRVFPLHRHIPARHSPPSCQCGLPSLRHEAIRRPFHSSRRLFQDSAAAASDESHYETLNVPVDASMADIKKSFYRLSKLHHPDHNPHDPHAPRRFMRLSEAYAVIGHSDKRAVYDRDVMRHRQHHHHHHRTHGSYHSTGPAGGRPASGLSRRRSAFRGPPPSFYRNSGAGASSGAASSAGRGQGHRPSDAGARTTTGGPGNANPADAGTRAQPDTPHFDRASNERTHRHIDERSAARRAAAAHGASIGVEPSMVVGFLVISVALVAGVVVPVMVLGNWRGDKKSNAKKTESAV